MTLTTLTHGEPWMTSQEHDLNRDLIRAIAEFLAAAGVPETALVALRVNDVAATWLLVRRLETVLTPAQGEPAPCPTSAQADAIGKCRERLRRAIKELEECCARTGTPVRQGLVEHMHQTIQKVEAPGPVNESAGNGNGSQKTESHAPEPSGNPNPAKNAPTDRQQTTGDSAEKNHTIQTARTAPATNHPENTATPGGAPVLPVQPSRPTPQDTGAGRNSRILRTWTARAKAPPR